MNAMGSMEKEIAREIRRSKVQRAVLGTIALAGALSVALVAPNAVQVLRALDRGMRRKYDPKYAASRAFFRLVDRGYITIEETTQGKRARLSVKGTRALGVLERPNIKLTKPKRWDGKWRVVIFDIKERRRLTRNRLRDVLKRLDFKRLQDSVWVYPYDREDIIILLKAVLRLASRFYI